jgi:hypothetical protein
MEKNYLILPGLENSSPVEMTPVQEALLPAVPYIELFWALVWGMTLFYVVYKYVLIPLYRSHFVK